MIAAWTIVQDVGDGFFGTEVPTMTITMMADNPATVDVDESMMPNCYNPADGTPANEFNKDMCGLIPERHNNARPDTDVATDIVQRTAATTVAANALARYDAGDESMIYVWLAAGADMASTPPSARRMLMAQVMCEDGTVVMDADVDGNPTPILIPAPTPLTMIDPTGGALGEFTDMCAGDRGVVQITMPDKSHAGMVFSHITQMMGHYRMNFAGYSMAGMGTCADADTDTVDDTDTDTVNDCM